MRLLVVAPFVLTACTNFGALTKDYEDLGIQDLSINNDATAPSDDLTPGVDGSPVDATPPDLTFVPDMTSSCHDLVRNGDETDVDCGGSCTPCDVGHACGVAADCLTHQCSAEVCELAYGPPSWVAVGTPATGTNPPTARIDLSLGLGPDGALYAMGGRSSSNGGRNNVERLDGDTLAWTTSSNLQNPRAAAIVITLPNQLAILYGTDTTAQMNVETMLTPPTFMDVTGLSASYIAGGGAVGSDGRVYVYGGNAMNNTSVGASNQLQAFVPGAQTLTTLSSMTTGRQSFGSAPGADGRLYAVGGYASGVSFASVEAYTIATDTWSAAASLPSPRAYTNAVLAPDGRIYVPGGADVAGGQIYASTVAYRAPSGTIADRWVKTASLATPRWRHAAAVGADGRVYVVAGESLTTQLRTVEAYGPSLTLSDDSVATGASITVTGSNFAASATVKLTLGSATGTLVGTGITDATGTLTTASATIPSTATAGDTRLYATDAFSRYPVSTAITITP